LKILFLTDNFPPEVNAPATRTFEHCREWVKAGMEVTVVTSAPNFPQGKIYAGYRNRLWQQEEMEGIRVIRVWTYMSANEGFGKRILDYLSFALMGSTAALLIKTDVMVATSPQFFTALGGCWAAFWKRKKWVMEVRDLWPESIRAVGAMRSEGKVFRWLERLELFLYRRAARVVVVTDSFKKNLIERGIPDEKIAVVKNGVLVNQFYPLEKDRSLTEALGIEKKFVIAYLGTHGLAHGLDFILNCAKNLPPDIHLLFVGDGAERSKLLLRKEKENLTNVTLLPSVPKREMPRYLALSDAALVNLRRSDTFKNVIPSKIFENAAMQRPILLGVEGEAQALVEHYEAGICFEPENETSFLDAIEQLRENTVYQNCQSGCVRLAADFDRARLADRMLSVLKSISEE